MAGVQGLVALVTGGASGIGRATAERFLKGGATVVIFDLPTSDGARVASDFGEKCTFVAVDIAVPKEVKSGIAAVEKNHRKLDVLVNCAGIVRPSAAGVLDVESFHALATSEVNVNALGTYTVIRAASKLMQQNTPGRDGERGVIISVGSVTAMKAFSTIAAYAGTKGYINSITLTLAKELAVYGIRVNCVNPGIINTPMLGNTPTKEAQAEAKQQFLFPKRQGEADEVAFLIQHVVENKYINGAAICIDGGVSV